MILNPNIFTIESIIFLSKYTQSKIKTINLIRLLLHLYKESRKCGSHFGELDPAYFIPLPAGVPVQHVKPESRLKYQSPKREKCF